MSSVLPETLADGRFHLQEVIGEGGMATVWRAFDQRLQRPRAVKVLSPAYAQRPSLRRRFLGEAQTMATLEEARVVRVFDMGEDGDKVYIVMELVEGGSLLDRVRDFGRLSPRVGADVVRQIAEALSTAHDHKVIHRDIKPHNILLTRTGDIRITDFGIAQVKTEDGDGMTKTGAMMGTWGYMAPEQKANAKSVDARADVYALGATLWAVLRDETPPELFMSDQEADMLSDIPFPLAEVIQKATRYRREERYGSALEFARALVDVVPLLPEEEDALPLVVQRPDRAADSMGGDTMMQFADAGSGTMVPDGGLGVSAPDAPLAATPSRPPPASAGSAPGASHGDETSGEGIRINPSMSSGTINTDEAPRRAVWPYALAALGALGVLAVIGLGAIVTFWPDPPSSSEVTQTPTPTPTPTPGEPTANAALVEPSTPPAAPVTPEAKAETKVDPKATAKAETKAETKVEATPTPVVEAKVEPEQPARVESTEPAASKERFTASGPSSVAVGGTANFSVTAEKGYTPTLYYRPRGPGKYEQKTMSGSGGSWKASLKVDERYAPGIDWFVNAQSVDGKRVSKGSAGSPQQVNVQ